MCHHAGSSCLQGDQRAFCCQLLNMGPFDLCLLKQLYWANMAQIYVSNFQVHRMSLARVDVAHDQQGTALLMF